VDLTPGSISIGVDRLVARGLVRRIESAEDWRARIAKYMKNKNRTLREN